MSHRLYNLVLILALIEENGRSIHFEHVIAQSNDNFERNAAIDLFFLSHKSDFGTRQTECLSATGLSVLRDRIDCVARYNFKADVIAGMPGSRRYVVVAQHR